MQDFIKQSSAHKRHQCCAILDHINVFQSRIIFHRRKNAQKNTGTRSQQILGLLRRGGCRCVVTAQRPRPRGCARRGVGSVLVGHGRAWLCGLGWAQVLWREAGRPAQLCDVLGSRTGGVRERCELYLDK